MKKYAVISIMLATFMVCVFFSYTISKSRAEELSSVQGVEISPVKGRLLLFVGDEFNPCWLFSGENEKALTGATFDVRVSFFGRIIEE